MSDAFIDEVRARGRIVFERQGLVLTYRCTCGAHAEEPNYLGVVCVNIPKYGVCGCGASAPWPVRRA